ALRAGPVLESARLERRLHARYAREHLARRAVPDRVREDLRVRRVRARAFAADRLPGGVLRGAPRGTLPRAGAAAPDPPVLDQLPDADARLDQPALPRRARHPDAELARDRAAVHLREPALLAGRLARG